jgi:hypothetical protein
MEADAGRSYSNESGEGARTEAVGSGESEYSNECETWDQVFAGDKWAYALANRGVEHF